MTSFHTSCPTAAADATVPGVACWQNTCGGAEPRSNLFQVRTARLLLTSALYDAHIYLSSYIRVLDHLESIYLVAFVAAFKVHHFGGYHVVLVSYSSDYGVPR